jgi:hypothetical protein
MTIEILEAQFAIERVLVLYAQLLDDLRFDEWGELFCEDASWTATWGGVTQRFETRTEIVANLREIEPKKAGAVRHCPVAPIIDIEGDVAYSWSDAIMFTIEDGANAVVSVGRYHDILRRADGRWQFYQRVFVPSGDSVPAGVRPSPAK